MGWLRPRAGLGLGLALALAGGVGPSEPAAAESARSWMAGRSAECAECSGGRLALDAFARQLPPGWALSLEHEPVFGGRMLMLEGGRAEGPTVLLIHGLGQNGLRDWLPVLPALAREYRVLAVDLPGFGFSDQPVGKYSPRNYAKLLAGLAARRGPGPVLAVGHSMGGAVALRLAADHPGRVGKLVLVDAAGLLERTAFLKHAAEPPETEAYGLPLLQRLNSGLRHLSTAFIESVTRWPDPTAVLAESDAAWASLLANKSTANAALALMEEDFSEAVHTLLPPAHIIWGEQDRVAPLRTGKVLARRLPWARLTVLRGVAHNPMATHPELLLPPLLQALEGEVSELAQEPPVPAGGAEALPDLACRGETGVTYRGHYRHVLIERCTAVTLRELSAESIAIQSSSVEMEDVHVRSPATALRTQRTLLRMTNGSLAGETAIVSEGSRLDLAGVSLSGREHAVRVGAKSRLLFSLSEVEQAGRRRYLHGSYAVARGVLEP